MLLCSAAAAAAASPCARLVELDKEGGVGAPACDRQVVVAGRSSATLGWINPCPTFRMLALPSGCCSK